MASSDPQRESTFDPLEGNPTSSVGFSFYKKRGLTSLFLPNKNRHPFGWRFLMMEIIY
jgi:hypothetical protein